MRLKLEEKEKQYRAIYEAFCKNPRIRRKEIADLLDVNRETALTRVREAHALGWISRSQIRLRSFKNLGEHVYFLKCEDPPEVFSQLVDKENYVYHALMCGETNMWVISRGEMGIPCECEVVLEGARSDYHVSIAPNHAWRMAIQKMERKIEEFNPGEHNLLKNLISEHWDEMIEWNSEYEILFRELNYDLSKKIYPVSTKHGIPWDKAETFMKNLSTYCTVITGYYPGGISSYDPYLFMFETDYEDFLIELFSELPTTALFFEVSDRLLAYLHVKKEFMRVVDSQVDIRKLQIPSMIRALIGKEVIKKESHGIVECYWNHSWES